MQKITVSEKALEEILKEMESRGLDCKTSGFRFGVKGGGCSGFLYHCGFSESSDKHDEVFVFPYKDKKVKIFVDKKSLFFVTQTHIDYKKALMGAGFQFINPNSKGVCGCGESFAV
jgi:iron-sulfur cluster assembly protein